MENINKKKLVEEIKRVSVLIKQHKNNLRRPHIIAWENGYPVWAEQREIDGKLCGIQSSQWQLMLLKEYVSVLCSLRAHMRSKVHYQGLTLEEQQKFLEQNKKKWLQFQEEDEIAA